MFEDYILSIVEKKKKTFTWWLALVLELLTQIPNYSNWRENRVLF